MSIGIEPPQSPKGLFKRMFSKKPTDVDGIRKKLGLDSEQQPSIQQAFEDQLEKDQETPPPPDIPLPLPAESSTRGQEGKTSTLDAHIIDSLQEELDVIEAEKPQTNLHVEVKLNGKEITTIKELSDYVKQISDEAFNNEKPRILLWIQTHLFDHGLARDISRVDTRKECLEVLSQEVRPLPALKKHTAKEVNITIDEVDQHFEQLTKEQEETSKELKEAVGGISLPERFTTSNGELSDSLTKLIDALEIADEATYEKVLTKDRKEFRDWIKGLAEKAAHTQGLNPAKLRTELLSALATHEERARKEQHAIKELLISKSSQLRKEQQQVNEIIATIADRENLIEQKEIELSERNKAFRKETDLLREEFGNQEKKQELFIENYRSKLEELRRQHQEESQELDRKRDEVSRLMAQHQKDLINLPLKFKEEQMRLEKERQAIDVRKAAQERKEKTLREQETELDQRRSAMEESLSAREQLIEQTITKIEDIDENIRKQREETLKMKQEIEEDGFKTYLHARLRQATDHSPQEELAAMEQHQAPLLAKIDECNRAIEQHKLADARKLYDELKESFSKEELPDHEREVLYDAIRELYANLHLAMLK